METNRRGFLAALLAAPAVTPAPTWPPTRGTLWIEWRDGPRIYRDEDDVTDDCYSVTLMPLGEAEVGRFVRDDDGTFKWDYARKAPLRAIEPAIWRRG